MTYLIVLMNMGIVLQGFWKDRWRLVSDLCQQRAYR